jgi:hypothetical protein
MENKKCANPNCGFKGLDDFYNCRTTRDRKQPYCKNCDDIKRKERHKRNPEALKKNSHKQYKKYKREVMNHYGTICKCCGEARLDFLTLDHINQDGADHRRMMGFGHTCTGFNFYLLLRKNNWPDLSLQVLCANCNNGKGSCGQCPHLLEREMNDGLGI